MDVHLYACEKSLDAYKYSLIHYKNTFIQQLKSGSLTARTIDEGGYDESSGMNALEYVALLSGNTDLQEKAKLEEKIALLESERKTFYSNKAYSQSRYEQTCKSFENNKSSISEMRADFNRFDKAAPESEGKVRPNLLKIDGVDSNDIKVMSAALSEIERTARTDNKYQKVGELCGLDVMVRTYTEMDKNGNFHYTNRFFVQGAGPEQIKYSYNNGLIASDPLLACSNFAKAMERVPAMIEQHENSNADLEKNIAVLGDLLTENWEKDGNLNSLKLELTKLDHRIMESLKRAEAGTDESLHELKPLSITQSEEPSERMSHKIRI